ncbi:glycosyltransferase [bacterium]|nr:glycosyltransferase [candidate division CSSED10-310 bacterium]
MAGERVDGPRVSVIVPLYNEQDNIVDLVGQLRDSLDSLRRSYEMLFIDDGSTDGTFESLKRACQDWSAASIIRFRRNFGQTAALSAGFRAARGQIVVTLDGDLQNDPADIGMLVEKLEEGWDMVSGWRKDRRDPFISRKLPSRLANWLIAATTGVRIHDLGCSLKAYRREIVKEIKLYGEMHRFLPVLASWVGAEITEVAVRHYPRLKGESKYGLSRTLRVILDLITVKFLMTRGTPIQSFGAWGVLSIVLGLMSGIATLLMRIFGVRTMTRNPLLIFTAILLIVGVQFIILGLLGELTIRTYYESQDKPIYRIREIVGLAASEEA